MKLKRIPLLIIMILSISATFGQSTDIPSIQGSDGYIVFQIMDIPFREFIDVDPIFDKLELEENLSVFQTIMDHKDDLPPFRFDCGKEDELIESNRNLHYLLENHKIEHSYKEFTGSHSVEYWSAHIEDSLSFFSKLL